MVRLIKSKKRSIKAIEHKISEGKQLAIIFQNNPASNNSEQSKLKLETWRISCGTLLFQLFYDEENARQFQAEFMRTSKKDNEQEIISNSIAWLKQKVIDIEQDIFEPRKKDLTFLQAIIVSIITTAGGILAGYFAAPDETKTIPGLSKNTMTGNWEYVCTSFDDTYQHGGCFHVDKGLDGNLSLSGTRIWKDTLNRITGRWCPINIRPLNWRTNWFFVVNDLKMYLEYYIDDGNNTIGYCTGNILSSDSGISAVDGNFYVVNRTPILNGKISFKRITNNEYLNFVPTLRDTIGRR